MRGGSLSPRSCRTTRDFSGRGLRRRARRRGHPRGSARVRLALRVGIVGGGILGLASGRLLARERPDVDVVVFEKETAVARRQTGHVTGVVHAGSTTSRDR